MSKIVHRKLQAKIASLQGPEWESSDEEAEKAPPAKPDSKDKNKSVVQKEKQSIIKLVNKKAAEEELDEDVSVLYIGHLPAEFAERDLRTFLMQFGKVERIRISRSVKTGQPRGYAFVKFTVASDAKIVAETLQGYFLGQRRLVCHLVPNAHARMFYDSDKVIARRKVHQEQQRKQHNRNLTNVSKLKEITARLVLRERKKRSKLAELGIDYDFPGYEDNMEDAAEQMKIRKKSKNSTKDETTTSLKEIMDEAEAANEASPAKKKQKDSVGSTSSSSRKRKDSVSSDTASSAKNSSKVESSSLKEIMDEAEAANETGSAKKKKQKDNSIGSTSSSSRKRKDSVGSVTRSAKKSAKDESSLKEILDEAEAANEAGSAKKKKQKDSVGSASSASRKKRKSKDSESSSAEKTSTNKPETPSKGGTPERAVQSDKKNKKTNKRRISNP